MDQFLNQILMCRVPCANIVDDNNCPNQANYQCGKCGLVMYCGKQCQTNHWLSHKSACSSSYASFLWFPKHFQEKRPPAFLGTPEREEPEKFQWGNMPALDMVGIHKSGAEYEKDFNMLFAGEWSLHRMCIADNFQASGDLGNVIMSVNGLPFSFSHTCTIVINDHEVDTAARNALFLMIAILIEPKVAASMILHLWYSALIPVEFIQILRVHILPEVQEILDVIENENYKDADLVRFTKGRLGFQVKLHLQVWQWKRLRRYFDAAPAGFDRAEALRQRSKIVMGTSTADSDSNDHSLFIRKPYLRVGWQHYRETGILLPFGASDSLFQKPNPTLYDDDGTWAVLAHADPLLGWSSKSIYDNVSAKNDLYGSLFTHVYKNLEDFCNTIVKKKIKFELCGMEAQELPEELEHEDFLPKMRFDRIEVSNITDEAYLHKAALSILGPLLSTVQDNPRATFLMLSMDACDNMKTKEDKRLTLERWFSEMQQASRFAPYIRDINVWLLKHMVDKDGDPGVRKVFLARNMFWDLPRLFGRYMAKHKFAAESRAVGLRMKDEADYSIVGPDGLWPFRLDPQSASQEDYDRMLVAKESGPCSRYVEWRCARNAADAEEAEIAQQLSDAQHIDLETHLPLVRYK